MPRIDRSQFLFTFGDGTPAVQVLHATGQTVVLDQPAVVGVLGAARANALRNALGDLHAAVETAVKAALENARASMDVDP